MSEASYRVHPHPGATRELKDLSPAHDIRGLRDRIEKAAERRQPSSHPEAKLLKNGGGFFRIRCRDLRAVCVLDSPDLLVLLVDERKSVYDRLDVAEQRARDLGVSA